VDGRNLKAKAYVNTSTTNNGDGSTTVKEAVGVNVTVPIAIDNKTTQTTGVTLETYDEYKK
jgi:hypothetical protein